MFEIIMIIIIRTTIIISVIIKISLSNNLAIDDFPGL